MTINEMERKSGLDRANIRFYEKEGLVTPERKENGYRDYSEDDLQLLLKIKLLRRLGFSLDSIRSLKEGNTDLEAAVARRLEAIGAQRQELNATEQVCHEMRQDRAQFSSLDARRYLDSYDRALHTPAATPIRPTVPAGDRILPPRIPWRRYFARTLDLSMVSLLIYAVLFLAFRVNINHIPPFLRWLLVFVEWGLLIPLEALFLSRFGTTPGKWIMGIHLEDADGRRLSFGRAADRAWTVFIRGDGMNMPLYNLWRNWKSYKDVRDLEVLEWDEEVTIVAKDYHHWRTALYLAAALVLFGLLALSSLVPAMPVNRGSDLTVAEFVENYNELADFHGIYNDGTLQTDGTFLQNGHSASTGVVSSTPTGNVISEEPLVLEWITDGDTLTGISFERQEMSIFSGPTPDPEGKQAIQLSAMALTWADTGLFSALDSGDILDEFTSHREGTLERDLLGYHLTYTVTPEEDTLHESGSFWQNNYHVSFRMERIY